MVESDLHHYNKYHNKTVNFYCGSDLVLTSDAVFIHKTVY